MSAEPSAALQVPPPTLSTAVAGSTVPTTSGMNVNQNVVVMQSTRGPGLLVRAVWFLFIGWWLSAFAIFAAYALCLTIIGLPLGFMLFNRLPVILTLRPRTDVQMVEHRGGVAYITSATIEQHPLWARTLWFAFVGWWLGGIYLGIAWLLCVLIITLPIGLYLFNRVGAVMTLLRH